MLNPFAYPSLNDVYGTDVPLMRAFEAAGIYDLVPTMVLPEGSLSRLHGISAKSEKRVTGHLHHWDIERRKYPQKIRPYLGEQFGSVNNTPLSVLQISVSNDGGVNYPEYAPLELISFIDKMNEHVLVSDIVRMGYDGLVYTVNGNGRPDEGDASVRDVQQDLELVKLRLAYLGIELEESTKPFTGLAIQPIR